MKRIKRTLAACGMALGLGFALPGAAQAATPANPQPLAYGTLVALYKPPSDNGTYFCMDEYRQGSGDGRPVVIKPCMGTWNQFWFWSPDGLIHSTNDGRCLWAHVADGPSGSPDAAAYGCNAGDPNQRWTFGTDHSVCNAANACLLATGMPGPRGSYHLMGSTPGASANSYQQFDWHPSASSTPVNPNG